MSRALSAKRRLGRSRSAGLMTATPTTTHSSECRYLANGIKSSQTQLSSSQTLVEKMAGVGGGGKTNADIGLDDSRLDSARCVII